MAAGSGNEESGRPPPRSRSRVGWIAAAGVAILAAGLATALVFAFIQRTAVLERTLSELLLARGFEGAEFTVARVGFTGLAIEDLRLGPDLFIGAVEVSYVLSRLAEGRVEAVRIVGLDLDLSHPRSGALGILRRAIAEGGGGGVPGEPPAIAIEDARIHGTFPWGAFSMGLRGNVNPDLSAAFETTFEQARLEIADRTLDIGGLAADIEVGKGAGRIAIHGQGNTIRLPAELGWLAPFTVDVSAVLEDGLVRVNGTASAARGRIGLVAGGEHDPGTMEGGAFLSLEPTAIGPRGIPLNDLFPALSGIELSGTVSASLSPEWGREGIDLVGSVELGGVSARAPYGAVEYLAMELLFRLPDRDGNIDVTLADATARITVSGQQLAIEDASARLIYDPEKGSLLLDDYRATLVHLGSPAWVTPLEVAGEARLEASVLTFQAEAATEEGLTLAVVEGRHDLGSGGGDAMVTVPAVAFAPGTLPLARLSPAGAGSGVVSGAATAEASLTWSGGKVGVEGRGEVERVSAEFGDVSFGGLSLALEFSSNDLAQGLATTIVGNIGRISAFGAEAAVEDISAGAAFNIGTGALDMKVSRARVLDLGSPALLGPLEVAGEGRLEGGDLTFRAAVAAAGGRIRADIRGHHELAPGTGGAEFAVPAVTFASGGLQPSDLSPLAVFDGQVSGTVAGEGGLEWGTRGVTGEARIDLADASLVMEDLLIDDLSLRLEISGAGTTMEIETVGAGAVLELAGERIGVEEVNALAVIEGSGDTVRLTIDDMRLEHLAAEPSIAPLRMRGQATLKGSDLSFDAALALASAGGGGDILSLSGRHGLSRGSGEAELNVATIHFRPQGPRPGDILPGLAGIGEVTGPVKGEASVHWSDAGYGGRASLVMDGLTVVTDSATVEGLSGIIELAELNPPTAAGPMELKARRIRGPVTLEAPLLRFAVEEAPPGKLPKLRVQRAQAGFAGGLLSIDDTLLDPAAPANRVVLEVAGADLGQLFDLLGLKGVSASGTLSGRVPMEIGDQGVTIDGASLTSDGAGTMRFQSAAARGALAGGGQDMTLVLDVLEDFQFDRLSLDIDVAPDGEATVRLGISGRNPAVRDGYPFVFNVNLSTNARKVLDAVLVGYRLSNQAFRATLGLRHPADGKE